MTPKLRLREEDKNGLLSCILKFLLPGTRRTRTSTHMIEAVTVSPDSVHCYRDSAKYLLGCKLEP